MQTHSLTPVHTHLSTLQRPALALDSFKQWKHIELACWCSSTKWQRTYLPRNQNGVPSCSACAPPSWPHARRWPSGVPAKQRKKGGKSEERTRGRLVSATRKWHTVKVRVHVYGYPQQRTRHPIIRIHSRITHTSPHRIHLVPIPYHTQPSEGRRNAPRRHVPKQLPCPNRVTKAVRARTQQKRRRGEGRTRKTVGTQMGAHALAPRSPMCLSSSRLWGGDKGCTMVWLVTYTK